MSTNVKNLIEALDIQMLTPKPEIYKTLVVSTSHISQKDSDNIAQAAKNGGGTIFVREFGFIVKLIRTSVIEEDIRFNKEDYEEFPTLVPIILAALHLGCEAIEVDVDGPEYEQLPIYDWE